MASVTDAERAFYESIMGSQPTKSLSDLRLAYNLMTLDGQSARQAPRQPGKGAIVISLDDGFVEQVALAALADTFGFKLTHYVISDSIGTGGKMNAAQIKALSDNGHEIGSHSKTHSDMTAQTPTNLLIEYNTSKSVIEGITGKEVTSFAYPLGARNITTDQVAYGIYGNLGGLSTGANLPYVFDADDIKPFMRGRLDWGGVAEGHARALAVVRLAASQPILADIYFHRADVANNPTMAQVLELFNLAASLRVPVITASQAFGSRPIVRDPLFVETAFNQWGVQKSAGATVALMPTVPTNFNGKSFIVNNPADTDFGYVTQMIPVEQLVSYALSYRAKVNRTSGTGGAYARIRWIDALNNAVGSASASAVYSTNAWGQVLLTAPAPAGAKFACIDILALNFTGTAEMGHVHFGDAGFGAFG